MRVLFLALLITFSGTPALALDAAKAARAIIKETNRRRATAGLASLAFSPAAQTAARWQAAYLAKTNTLGHVQPYSSRRTIGDRVRAAGVEFRYAAENVALDYRLNYIPGRLIYPRDGNPSVISYTPNGPPLETHSPDSFARSVVGLWFNSAGHRRNLLSREATQIGCAIADAPPRNGDLAALGRIMVAQVFVTPR